VYLKAEELAFRQAAVMIAVADQAKTKQLSRGVDARKILVNPNGADLDSYAPASAEGKRQLRSDLGFTDRDRVIGFTGTFGGWHGIDVLAAAIPKICAANRCPVLIIGDSTKPQLDAEVERAGLGRVRRVSRVAGRWRAPPQACDILCRRTTHGGRAFFGSPTKIFEYMAMAAASSPAISSRLAKYCRRRCGSPTSPATAFSPVISARCCNAGDTDEFVEGVVALARHPRRLPRAGAGAQQAVADHYSWRRHVGGSVVWAEMPGAAGTPRSSPAITQGSGPAPVEQPG
jgi:glycosyltransferase involved in cell wall biosynthesis